MKRVLIFCLGLMSVSVLAQEKPLDMKMDFEQYDPPSTLKVEEHRLSRAKFPFIDIHNHQGNMNTSDFKDLIEKMDKLNMGVMINLSGRGFRSSGDHLEKSIENINNRYPTRFVLFTNVDFTDIDNPEWGARTVKQLEADIKRGAKGLKIYKSLGLHSRDSKGNRIRINDPRIDPIWAKCGELGVPVLIHTADPKPFWDPIDNNNERWLELKTHPGRRYDETFPSWESLIADQHDIFRKHPKTNFINAHLGWYGNDLKKLGELMDKYPNMLTEIGAVIAELGRQPRTAKAFLTKYQDRVLFGKDSWVPDEYETYFRVLESEDEYFPYHKRYHAFWRMYGIGLPDEILKKIYYKNALRILPNMDKSQFPK
ncbi:MAG TPA: amidohydrolase family protein [Cyclobacteriaceae bacterium]|jgi:predicted TIM-barrel fold metal-dependent hydrolase|nr:amidohydrolase [Cytophagales bacterium]HMR56045.1 amidohydrolase family protein [Cyclobacteriaceae bacterium]HRE65270.1 amidohydrolase family protein [Cyclobacteriaceae bacterium]HRF34845.1 amidohydrolase family protein [Cyclobacteriaceae bacterium]